METNNAGDAGSHFIFTDGNNKAEMLPGQDEAITKLVKCRYCGNSHQTPLVLGTDIDTRRIISCGNCYSKLKANQGINFHDDDTRDYINARLQMKCPEGEGCDAKKVELGDYDAHIEASHNQTTNLNSYDRDLCIKHRTGLEEVEARRRMKYDIPSTSLDQGCVQHPQTEPKQPPGKLDSLSGILKPLDLKKINRILHNCLAGFDQNTFSTKEDYDTDALAELIADNIVDKDKLKQFYNFLCRLNTKESIQYDDFNHFCSELFPEFARENSSYMNKQIDDAITDKHDRRARKKFCVFFNSCENSHLNLLKEVFEIYTGLSSKEEQQIANFRREMMIQICDKSPLTLNDILQRIDNVPYCSLIANCLKREVVFDYTIVSADIRKEFNQTLGQERNDIVTCDQINDILNPYQCAQLALLLRINRGDLRKLVDFNSLYDIISAREATVKELVLAMIDAQLFSGEVKKAITNRYGDPVKDVLTQEEVILMQKSLPEYMSGKIGSKLMNSGNRLARHKLLRCFENCDPGILNAMDRYFELGLKSQYENGFDFADMVCVMNSSSITVDRLFSFFKTKIKEYSNLIDILLSEEQVDLTLRLSNEELKNKLDHAITVKTTNESQIMVDLDSKFLAVKDKKRLAVMLIKEEAKKHKLVADAKFSPIFCDLLCSGRPWKDLLAALQDLDLMEAFRQVERMMSMAQ